MRQRRTARGQKPSHSCLCVVDPGTTTLRVLIVEIPAAESPDRREREVEGGGQATVWGWGEVLTGGNPGAAEKWATGASPGASARTVEGVRPLLADCEEALRQAERMAQERAGRWLMADQMIVGLPASHLRGSAWPMTQRRSQPERPIDEQELSGLLGRTLRLAVNRLTDDPDWRLVDTAVAALTVDGHGVTDPVGFRGRELGASVFAALTRREKIDSWTAVAKQLEFSALTLAVAPLALAASLSGPHVMLIDVGGATTDLTCCRAGRPLALDSLAAGGVVVTRSLIQKWALAPDKAERLQQLYSSGRLAEGAGARIAEAIRPSLQGWLAETELALARLNQDEPLPQYLVLLGGGSATPGIADLVRTLAWSERLHFVRHPEVGHLRPTDVPGVVNRTDLGRQAGDVTALALAGWAAQQARPLDRPARLLAAAPLCRES